MSYHVKTIVDLIQNAKHNLFSEDANEQIFFLHRDGKSGWTVNTKIHLVQPKSKDTVNFDISAPYER